MKKMGNESFTQNNITAKEKKYFKYQEMVSNKLYKDCDKYKRSLVEQQEDLEELNQNVAMFRHHIIQLKQEIKESEIIIKNQAEELNKSKQEIELWMKKYKNLQQLNKTINEKLKQEETEKLNIKKELFNEKNIILNSLKEIKKLKEEKYLLTSQLSNKNKEILSMNEKLNDIEILVSQEKKEYNTCLNEIKLLKFKIKDNNHKISTLTINEKSFKDLQFELLQLKEELCKKDIYNSLLMQMFETPTNIHKWRIIQDTLPDKFQLVQKVSILQQLLTNKIHEIEKLKSELKQKELEIIFTKKHIKSYSMFNMKEVEHFKHQLNKKCLILKSIAAERNMFCNMNSELKRRLNDLDIPERFPSAQNKNEKIIANSI